jgi:pimeloyl-ACP methyl ester carboxylesterase
VIPPPQPLDRRWAEVHGLAIHAWRSPGPPRPTGAAGAVPLVLVHGLGVSSRYFLRLAGRLAAGRPVLAPDLPGFGRSATPPRPLDVHAQADFLAAWMPAMGLERAAFLGHSLGSQVVADLALRHPHRVERLVLAAPTIDDGGRSVPRELLRLLRDVPREPFSLVPIVTRDYLRAGLGRVLRTLRYALADRLEEKLPLLDLPVLVLRGARDPVVSERWSEKVAALLPHGRLAVVPGAAHALQFSHPREVAALLDSFLDEGLPSPPPPTP